MGGASEPEKKTEEKEAKGQQQETTPKHEENPVNKQEVPPMERQTKGEETPELASKGEEPSKPISQIVKEESVASELVQEESVKEHPIQEWQREPVVEIKTPVEVKTQEPEPESQPKKDHSPTAQEESDPKGKELLKFEESLKEYEEELEIRPKKELVTNVPVPLPNPVYQKLKDLEPYFTLKQKGFIQKVITDATIKEVKRLIQEVETKKLKKLRK
jgi:hypothetical protein